MKAIQIKDLHFKKKKLDFRQNISVLVISSEIFVPNLFRELFKKKAQRCEI